MGKKVVYHVYTQKYDARLDKVVNTEVLKTTDENEAYLLVAKNLRRRKYTFVRATAS